MNTGKMECGDKRLDALLDRAAPAGALPGFAERVVAAARARRLCRRRRLRVALVGSLVAAAAALAAGAWAIVGRTARGQPEPQIAASPEKVEPPPAASASFALRLPVTGQARQRVMMARFDGRCVVAARPNDVLADELEELLREPRAMVGSVSSGDPGPSVAARVR